MNEGVISCLISKISNVGCVFFTNGYLYNDSRNFTIKKSYVCFYVNTITASPAIMTDNDNAVTILKRI